MTRRSSLLAAAGLAAVLTTAALADGPFRGHASTMQTISSAGNVAVSGAAGRTGVVRARYVLPRTWRRTTSIDARTLRFDTGNSCRHVVRLTPRLVEAADVPATQRAAELTPAASAYVRAYGTREGAAFRVVRTRGSADVVGVLVQPLPRSFTPGTAAGRRVFAEIRATGTADPRLECHAGGPRGVADAFGDSFGAGSVGGFVLR